MAAVRWQQVQQVFCAAIECADADREALFARECGEDDGLRREVESLLAAHERSGLVDQLASKITAPALWRARLKELDWQGKSVAQYSVREPLGAGAMGLVYRARDERLGRQVALKFLPSHMSTQSESQQRFLLEARAAAALDHPNICTIHEIGTTSDGQLFIAMPLYEGETLQARMERARLTPGEALDIALQVASGLARAHESSVVHRDVKPSNVMLLADGGVKVLDFGVARVPDMSLTTPGNSIVGTVAYMSPEQARGEATDARTDVWSLGVVLYEMLAGTRPPRGENLQPLRRDDVPAEMDQVLARALAKDARDRYASMSDMAADLAQLRGGEHAHSLKKPAPGERRRAAVLVTTVCDYAALVEQLTPVRFAEVVTRIRQTAAEIVRRHGGVVNQAVEDEIVALFGIPASHEDDDLRAVRAAMEIHAYPFAEKAGLAAGSIELRSGVHAGPIVAQRLSDGQRRYGVTGMAAQLAARIAAIAPRGSIYLSAECERIVAPFVHTAPQPAVVLQADSDPLVPHRVIGESGLQTRLEAAARKGLTPYAGRQSELATLETQFSRARAGHGEVVLVVGEAGLGKSRLLYELQARLDSPGVRVLHGRCRSYGGLAPYSPFVEALRELLGVTPAAGRELSADDVVSRILGHSPELEPFVSLYLHLLSLPSESFPLPQHLRGEPLQSALGEALTALLIAVADHSPVLLLLEDWHWSDEGSRETLRQLIEAVGAHALLAVVTSRPDGAGHDTPWLASRLQLAPLNFENSLEIIRGALHVNRVSEELARHVHERTGGNPFFLEEICQTLIERDLVTVLDGEAAVIGGVAALGLPDTVQAVIRARLDGLDPESLEVLRIASVIGRDFSHGLLVDSMREGANPDAALARLRAAGLVQQTGVVPESAYRFKHVLTREVTYDSLLAHQQRALHGRVGRAIERRSSHDEYADVLAHHLGLAQEWTSAVHYGRRAAEHAIALSQFADALATLDRVREWLGCVPESERSPELLADVLLQQERMCEILGQRGRQQELIGALVALLAPLGASERLAQSYLRQGDLLILLKRYNEADRVLSTSLRLSRERRDAGLERHVLRSIGLLRWHEGRYDEALTITETALEIDRQRNDELAVAGDLANRGFILKSMGQYELARASLEEAIAMPAQAAEPATLAYTLQGLANVYRSLGDLDRAMELLQRTEEISQRRSRPLLRSFHLMGIAHAHLQRGEIEQALRTYEQSVETSRRARHADGLVQSLRAHGEVLSGLGRHAEALPRLEEAARLFGQLGDQLGEAEMLAGIAVLHERAEMPSASIQTWEEVRRLRVQSGDARGELDALNGIVRMQRRAGVSRDQVLPNLEDGLALAAKLADKRHEASLRNTLGILEWEDGRYATALRHYERFLVLARDLGDRSCEGLALNSLGVTLSRLNRHEEARTVLEESIALNEAANNLQLQAHALGALAEVWRATGKIEAASDCQSRAAKLRSANATLHH